MSFSEDVLLFFFGLRSGGLVLAYLFLMKILDLQKNRSKTFRDTAALIQLEAVKETFRRPLVIRFSPSSCLMKRAAIVASDLLYLRRFCPWCIIKC